MIGELKTANANHHKALYSAERFVDEYEWRLDDWLQQGREAFREVNEIHPDFDEWNAASQKASKMLERAQQEIFALTGRARETMQSLEEGYRFPSKVVDEWLQQQEAERAAEQENGSLSQEPVEASVVASRDDVSVAAPVQPSQQQSEGAKFSPQEQLNTDIASRADTLFKQYSTSGDLASLIEKSNNAYTSGVAAVPDKNGNFQDHTTRDIYIEAAALAQARHMLFNRGERFAAVANG